MDMDGTSALVFPNMQAEDYYLSIRHRNHIGIRTLNPITFTASSGINLDFTDTAVAVLGTESRKDVNGVQLLWSGDATADNTVNASDRSESWNERNQPGYLTVDVNLDGNCNAGDRSLTWNNRNKSGGF